MTRRQNSQSCIVLVDENNDTNLAGPDAFRALASRARTLAGETVSTDQAVVVYIPSASEPKTPPRSSTPEPHHDFASAMRDVERECYG